MWHKLIQTFVDNPVNEGSPCISRKGVTVLKLKLAVASLALTSLILLLMGSTYFTAAAAIVCTAVALPLAGYLTWKYLIPDDHSLVPFVLWVPVAELPALYAFKDLGVMNVPLGATIEPEKMAAPGGFIAFTGAIAILLAVTVPTSPTRDDDED